MRHLLLTTEFRPMVGGIARYLHGLAAALTKRGEDVRVVACGVEGAGDLDAPYDVRSRDAVERRLGDRWGDGFVLTRLANSAACALRRSAQGRRAAGSVLDRDGRDGPRLYVGVWNETAHGWCRRFREEGVPYRLFAYGREVVRSLDPVRRRWRAGDFAGAELVYGCSAATASLVERRFEGVRATPVLPGVSEPRDLREVREAAERLRRELAIGADSRVLVTVGRLERRKGVRAVLRVLGARPFSPPVRYLVAGSGPEGAALRRMARELDVEDEVEFLGRVDERTKWAVYAAGDLFVMPNTDLDGTDWEGFGIVLLEAAVMGLPAVAGRTGGTVEAIEHGRTGYLVDPGSRSELEEALRRLVEDPERARELGRRARRRALDGFTWDRAAEQLLEAT